MRAACSFDEAALRVDLVRAIDREVKRADLIDVGKSSPRLFASSKEALELAEQRMCIFSCLHLFARAWMKQWDVVPDPKPTFI